VAYRDDLAAAQARIAELEKEVAVLSQGESGDSALAELEQKYLQALAATKPEAERVGRYVLIGVLLLPAIGLAMAMTSWMSSAFVVAIGAVLGIGLSQLTVYAMRREAAAKLTTAKNALSEARRVRALERALRDKNMRVATDESERDPESADLRMRR
jgi:hypothetical protein